MPTSVTPSRAQYAALGGLIVLIWLWYWPTLSAPLMEDSLWVNAAARPPGADTWGFWLRIFTRPNPESGRQYRPLSFFAVFYVGARLFGAAPLPYHLLGLCLLSAAAALFWSLVRRSAGTAATLLGAVFLAFHPVQGNSTLDPFAYYAAVIWGLSGQRNRNLAQPGDFPVLGLCALGVRSCLAA